MEEKIIMIVSTRTNNFHGDKQVISFHANDGE